MTDDLDMYGATVEDEQPKQLGPVALLARKVDRLETELRMARDEIEILRRLIDSSTRGVHQLRTKLTHAGNHLDNIRKSR